MVYMISYELRSAERDYASLSDAISRLGEARHCFQSTWVVDTPQECNAVRELVRAQLSPSDSVLVVQISRTGWSGWMPQDFWPWLQARNF